MKVNNSRSSDGIIWHGGPCFPGHKPRIDRLWESSSGKIALAPISWLPLQLSDGSSPRKAVADGVPVLNIAFTDSP